MTTTTVKFSSIILVFAMILVGSCAKKASQQCDCQAPADKIVQAVFSPNIGGVNVSTQLFYSTSHKDACEIALNDHLDRERFTRISSSLQGTLGFTENAAEVTKAFTIFLSKEIHKDSSVSLDDVLAVSRYFSKDGKLYHQFFAKAEGTASLTEVKDLSAEVDGVIFNYMHTIAKNVLVASPAATAYFLKTEDSKDLYKNLRNPHDDLGWRLKVYIKKNKLDNVAAPGGSTINSVQQPDPTCGTPCKANNGQICRNGDRPALINEGSTAACGPKDIGICLSAVTYQLENPRKLTPSGQM